MQYILCFGEIRFVDRTEVRLVNFKERRWVFCLLHYGARSFRCVVCLHQIYSRHRSSQFIRL